MGFDCIKCKERELWSFDTFTGLCIDCYKLKYKDICENKAAYIIAREARKEYDDNKNILNEKSPEFVKNFNEKFAWSINFDQQNNNPQNDPLVQDFKKKVDNYRALEISTPIPSNCPCCQASSNNNNNKFHVCTFCKTKVCQNCMKRCETTGCPVCIKCYPSKVHPCQAGIFCDDNVCENCCTKYFNQSTQKFAYICNICQED